MLFRRFAGAVALLSSIAACGGNALQPADGGDAPPERPPAYRGDAPAERPPLAAPSMHRPVAVVCPTDRPAATCMHVTPGAAPVNGGNCTNDGDCTSGHNGRCDTTEPFEGDCSTCSYDECFADVDCAGRAPCDCRAGPVTGANVCAAGNCRVDADCGAGGYCSPSTARCAGSSDPASVGYFCRTPADTCVEDADCASTTQSQQCRFDATAGHWRCIDSPTCPA
ncbi:MAG TPA: hypothetical protein VH560_03620 [Polyangia bacterium]|nr:hypothetical protein [Polyangia bacterium]